jgi:uncharacterized phage-like protein YoqJ
MEFERTCCFTGHRPNHLPLKGDEGKSWEIACNAVLIAQVEQAWQDGYRRFLTGMAPGGDMMWAEAVLACRMVHPDIILSAVIPCKTQTKGWKEADKRRYDTILSSIDPKYQVLIQQEYDRGCMLRRDRYMVAQSQRIVALYDGVSKGGTKYTLEYALSQGLDAVIIDPHTLEMR